MTSVNDLHPQAMDLADEAFRHRHKNNEVEAKRLFLQALQLEQKAAQLLPATQDSEPSRSILYRSAASLAYNGEDYETAERLIAYGLVGFPPIEIKEELKDLYENINFMRHLHSQGIVLSKNQWEMTLHGNATSYGGTSVEPLMLRVEKVTALFYRTIERLLGLDYRITGSTKREIKEAYGLYVNAFTPGSFKVAFQIGAPEAQIPLIADFKNSKPVEPDSVVDEVMSCLEILESGKTDLLRERIHDKTYYQNFVGIAKQIAPDGDDIKLVAFRVVRNGRERPVTLRRSSEQIIESLQSPRVTSQDVQKVTLAGVLTFASSPRSKSFGTVHLYATDSSHPHVIRVPIALMKDVVQPYYEEQVVISCHSKNDNFYLDDISHAP